jgi:vacuolar protein sorting-associated protein 45
VKKEMMRRNVRSQSVLLSVITQLVFVMLNLAGAEQRQDDLFANENFFSRGKSALKGLKGVDNVYTQHSPHLLETIDNLMKGRLKETSYPYAGGSQAPPPMQRFVSSDL